MAKSTTRIEVIAGNPKPTVTITVAITSTIPIKRLSS